MDLHGGTVEARSEEPGKGSEVLVRLPRTRDVPAMPQPPGLVETSRMLGILVVDDHVDSTDSLALLLTLEGHEVRKAYDGPDAISVASTFKPGVIMLDIGLPGMDGFDVARRLKAMAEMKDSRLAAFTGYGDAETANRARMAGLHEITVKPIDLEELRRLLPMDDRQRSLRRKSFPGDSSGDTPSADRQKKTRLVRRVEGSRASFGKQEEECSYDRARQGKFHLVSKILGHFAAIPDSPVRPRHASDDGPHDLKNAQVNARRTWAFMQDSDGLVSGQGSPA